jgi:hypothetical protein
MIGAKRSGLPDPGWPGALLGICAPLAAALAIAAVGPAGGPFAIVPFLLVIPAFRHGRAYARMAVIDRESALETAVVVTMKTLVSSWELLNAGVIVLCLVPGPGGMALVIGLAARAIVALAEAPSLLATIPASVLIAAVIWSASLRLIIVGVHRRALTAA